jgi:hypothetical protein
VLSIAPALIAFVVLLIVARVRRSVLPVVPGMLAAAALAPVIGTFVAVRAIIAALQAMAMNGGGIAAVSAGLAEATAPLVWASACAAALALIALVVAIFAGRSDAPRRSLVPVLISLLAAAAIVIGAVQYRNTARMIVSVIDPSAAPPTGSIASVSQQVSSGLLTAAGSSALLALLLGACVVVSAVTDRRAGRMLAFFALLVVLAAAMSFNLHRGWAARFHHTPHTGEVQH